MSDLRKEKLKELDAIGFDELDDFLAESIHSSFRKGCENGGKVWNEIKQMHGDDWSDAIDWSIWAMRVSTGREKK